MGYATKNLRNGATIVTPQFIGVADADGKIPLLSITCRDDDSDLVYVSTLDSVGAIVKTYNWINDGKASYWIDGATGKKPNPAVTINPGEGLWVEGDSTENEITFPAVEL